MVCSQRVGLRGLGVESMALEDRSQLCGERGQDLAVLCGQTGSSQGEDLSIGQGQHEGGLVGARRRLTPGGGRR